ncbi:MAG: hypothetical protein NWE81_01445 [Candidatus Bathyarchaeota archaeon]|nr:hypothetical protein [Candidatus Bathyarchaeota archaeon]
MPSKKAYVVAFMVGLVLLTSLCFLEYQKINQPSIELERLRIGNERFWETAPTVRVTNENYPSLIPFWDCPEWRGLSNKTVVWGKENLVKFISVAAFKAGVLNLNSAEIFQVLVNLTSTEMEAFHILMLPCVVEKAKYKDVDAWIIVFNWEINAPTDIPLGHIRIFAVECGTQTVLYSESCY